MPFVPVPKDLSKVKTKIALNLTKRQLICFSAAASVGIPTYLSTRTVVGSEGAVLLMIGLMLPFFFIAMYEKDGQPAEKIVRNIIRTRFLWPSIRPYKTENLYKNLTKEVITVGSQNQASKIPRKPPTGSKIPSRKKQCGTKIYAKQKK